ncbi:MAG: zincin-like metallopeptidase domain-containing protein [bacterium]|nr:zincin-like metallopeptidase domain-containing protein [bacterium]
MDIYKEVTDRIIAQMENGIIPWQKPWVAAGSCISHATGKPYSLLNQMMLGKAGEYVTFKQCQQEGGKVKKGEKASMVVFWKWIEQKVEETDEVKEVPFLRYYNVFHIDQCEGLTAKHTFRLPATANADEKAESMIASYVQQSGVKLIHQAGNRASYTPSADTVTLPLLKQFSQNAEYYSTAFHELTHSTGHASRLNRLDKTAFFGTEAYSKEELVAEIGAAALVNHAGLETVSSFRNSTAYIQNWLQVLKNDKRFIVNAAGKAEKAVDLILGAAG